MKKNTRLHLWLIRFVGLIVPERLRADWRQEWEAELRHREALLAQWDKLTWQNKLELWRRSLGAVWDALLLQPRRWEDEMIQDIRFGVRMLLKQPGFTLIAVLTLALGIGANTAIFSVANAVLLQPLPLKDADRIVDVRTFTPREARAAAFSYPDYLALRQRASGVVDLFTTAGATPVLGAGGDTTAASEAEELRGLLVTGSYFSALGGTALLGRTLAPEDDQTVEAQPVVVLSHGFWQRRFGAAADVVGQTLRLNGRAFTVVGVAEAGFRGVGREAPDVWLPFLLRNQFQAADDRLTQRDTFWLEVLGRLQPGVSRQQAEAALDLAFAQLKPGRPEYVRNLQIKLYPASLLAPHDRQIFTTIASVALGAVTLVLLIACLNVAGLMLARLAARQREIAVRLSLGASRLRLLRQLFTESLLLAGVSGLAGLLIERWGARALSVPLVEFLPRGVDLNWRVLAYTMGLCGLTALVTGLLPAWQTTRFNLVPALKQGAAGFNQRAARFQLRNVLVVAQIAISLVLLVGAGLFARALLHALTIEPGFETKHLAVVFLRLGARNYDEAKAVQFHRQLQERFAATPLIRDAVWVAIAPLDGERDSSYGPDGRPPVEGAPKVYAMNNVVSPNYFAALGVPLLAGRSFTAAEADNDSAVIIINETLARRHWPNESPLGKSLWTDRRREIIGVAKDTRYTRLSAVNEPYFYLPAAPKDRLNLQLLVRSEASFSVLAETLRSTIRSLDPQLRSEIEPLSRMIEQQFRPLRLGALLASLAGLLALALAALGLYGVLAFTVGQRTHEIGVRLALGAQAADVLWLVLRQGLRLALIGVALGLAIAVAATRVLAAALYGISPTDPLTFGVITFLLGTVVVLACWVPARRATKVDPLVALRHE